MSKVYAVTILVSAFLLFLVEPMFAKMALPLLGGSPAVWNTAVVFYQVALLIGYVYAHAATAWLGVRRQGALHAILLLLPFLVLPIAIPPGWSPPAESNPIPWLLTLMLVRLGLPFVIVSASSPMLQKWFASTTHPAAADPYFLYTASNAGSMIALLGYPLLVEPNLPLATQSGIWAVGYGLFVALTLGCAALLWRSLKGGAAVQALTRQHPERRPVGLRAVVEGRDSVQQAASFDYTPPKPLSSAQDAGDWAKVKQSSLEKVLDTGAVTAGQRMRWVLLAFVPSSLMLSVTTYLSTNIAPFPLLWVIPLAIYLLTFVLVFAGKPPLPHALMVRAFPIALLPLVIAMAAVLPTWVLIPLHLAVFFVIAMACHGALANDRPSPRYLTEFYLWLSVGGALGGIFNALLAPILFTTLVEYPLGLVLAALLVRRPDAPPAPTTSGGVRFPPGLGGWGGRWLDLALPALLAGLMTGAFLALRAAGVTSTQVTLALVFGLPAILCFSFSRRPIRFALGIAAMFTVGALTVNAPQGLLFTERTFFGINRVLVDGDTHTLRHGDTLHGAQSLDPDRRCEPLSYYYPTGPIGQVFAAFRGAGATRQIAVVGLGAGALAGYSEPGQPWTFYEIDPGVERIARDPRYFTFLRDCAPEAAVILGDARLSLVKAPAGQYDLLVLDAYSSDSIPVHLITREALALYLEKLASGGLLAFHVSNRYLDLEPVLGNLAQDAGLMALFQIDREISEAEKTAGKMPSEWVLMARRPADLGPLTGDPRWKPLPARPGSRLWTDDFSSILSVLRWR
ncbi:MAG: fused MFS/spermidine synthase [Chloroflexi bacterium]|nr:fused MFS/spermidine synthase [Chloroflexota bacterium]